MWNERVCGQVQAKCKGLDYNLSYEFLTRDGLAIGSDRHSATQGSYSKDMVAKLLNQAVYPMLPEIFPDKFH